MMMKSAEFLLFRAQKGQNYDRNLNERIIKLEKMTEIDVDKMRALVIKLLDKAGEDPRLTPRLLRNKMEDKMNLERGALKVKRELIKTLIVKW